MTKPQETLKFKRARLTKEQVAEVVDKHVREVGRPSKMDDPEYRAMICDTVVALGTQGMSPYQISMRIDVDMRTMIHWGEMWPEFSQALTRAKQLEQGWWEAQAHENLKNKNFNANLWYKSAIFRFKDYREAHNAHKLEVTGKDGKDLAIEVNHNMLMDTTRRVMMILEDAASKTVEAEVIEVLPPPEK